MSSSDTLGPVSISVDRTNLSVRQPGAIVKVGPYKAGIPVTGWTAWTVSSNSFYEADTFHVEFALDGLPQTYNANWFSKQKAIFVEILAGLPAKQANPQPNDPGLDSLIYGRVDDIEINAVERTLTLTGRDLTAVFIDNKIEADYRGQTSSWIATELINSHGLTPNVQATKTIVGSNAGSEQILLFGNRSEWDLLAYLANKEGFVCFVQGTTVNFIPNPTGVANAYPIKWVPPQSIGHSPQCPVMELTFSRSLTVAMGIRVTVRSSNVPTGRAVVASYPADSQVFATQPFGNVQNFSFKTAPNQTPQQVQTEAQKRYDAIVQQEMKLTAALPGDNDLTILTPIQISGTGTQFDQVYYPRQINREMDFESGYRMTVEASNVNADTSPSS